VRTDFIALHSLPATRDKFTAPRRWAPRWSARRARASQRRRAPCSRSSVPGEIYLYKGDGLTALWTVLRFQVRTRLFAGAEWIRTFGSAMRSYRRQRDRGVTPPDPGR
jgi:hypothetical protein